MLQHWACRHVLLRTYCSQLQPTSLEALKWLEQHATTTKIDEKELRKFFNFRCFASAHDLIPIVRAGTSGSIFLRWPKVPERNINILIPTGIRLGQYTAEVRAMYYGILSAIQYGDSHLFLYSGNEIAVKVANSIFKANREKKMLDPIRSVVLNPDARTTEHELQSQFPVFDDLETEPKSIQVLVQAVSPLIVEQFNLTQSHDEIEKLPRRIMQEEEFLSIHEDAEMKLIRS